MCGLCRARACLQIFLHVFSRDCARSASLECTAHFGIGLLVNNSFFEDYTQIWNFGVSPDILTPKIVVDSSIGIRTKTGILSQFFFGDFTLLCSGRESPERFVRWAPCTRLVNSQDPRLKLNHYKDIKEIYYLNIIGEPLIYALI